MTNKHGGRPIYGVNRKPNETTMRVKRMTKNKILEVYNMMVGPGSSAPLGDKLDTVLTALIKKEEAQELEILRLRDSVKVTAEELENQRNKFLEFQSKVREIQTRMVKIIHAESNLELVAVSKT